MFLIGTRGSRLAVRQAELVRTAFQRIAPHVRPRLRVIVTTGDRLKGSLTRGVTRSGKGLFTKEIERALLCGEVRVAVHSLKDLPVELPDRLMLGGVLRREDPRDVLVTRDGARLAGLRRGATVGTSSLRRKAMLRAARPDLRVVNLRGNLNTRLGRIEAGQMDGVVVAAAGLKRLGRADLVKGALPESVSVPAPGQGAIALEVVRADAEAVRLAAKATDRRTWTAVTAERAFLQRLGGGCQAPLGALARSSGGRVLLRAAVLSRDGRRAMRGTASGPAGKADGVGIRLAERFLARGAARLLNHRTTPSPPSGGRG